MADFFSLFSSLFFLQVVATVFTWHYSSVNLLNKNWNLWGGNSDKYMSPSLWSKVTGTGGNLPMQNGNEDWRWHWCNPDPNVSGNCNQGPNSTPKSTWTNWPCPCQDSYGHCAFCDLKWAKLIAATARRA